MSQTNAPVTRMKAEARRELILDAAMSVFGDYGYVGTTTDQVARAAGVSQPYVVRIFGTKENLFVEVLNHAFTRLMTTFRVALTGGRNDAAPPADASVIDAKSRLGVAYVELLRDRGLLLTLMHAFVLGSDPAVGAKARAAFMDVYRFLRDEAGLDHEQAQNFLAQGMLINTIIGLRLTDDFTSDSDVNELLVCSFPEKLELMLSLAPRQGDRSL